jgi:aldehyde:ferredoxin oxidoreductase
MAVAKGGYSKVLRVNLTNRTAKPEPIREEWLVDFVGGRGLGVRYLWDEIKPGTDPLSPENKLIFGVGPLAAGLAQSMSRWMIVTKSPATGGYMRSIGGGMVGAELRFAGYDIVIVEGMADKPTYVYIKNDKVEFRDASHLWGMETEKTHEQLRLDCKDRRTRSIVIGPSGEKLVMFAGISADRLKDSEHGGFAARGGVGAVMGSKNLKAIAVRGDGKIPIAYPDLYKKAVQRMIADYKGNHVVHGFEKEGTQITEFTNVLGMFPVRNFQKGVLPHWEKLESSEYTKLRKRKSQCYTCTISCGSVGQSPDGGEYGGILRMKGPEYETIWAATGSIDYSDISYTYAFDQICDDLGLDTISTGAVLGFAYELYDRGILTKTDTDGLELTWGNHRAALELIRRIARREGQLGDVLALGVKRAAQKIGKGSDYYAIHSKGVEFPAYDPRGAKAHGLNLSTANTGANHNYGYSGQEMFGIPSPIPIKDRFSTENKGAVCKLNQDYVAMYEMGIYCVFPGLAVPDLLNMMGEHLYAATGVEEFRWGPMFLMKAGDRIYNLERMFNLREGLTGHDDLMPKRFLKEPLPDGAAQGQIFEENDLLPQYYAVRGWDSNGVPTKEKLEDLNLSFALQK